MKRSSDGRAGKVFLIGAGPGDIELLTLKAVRCIASADVILLDSLVNPEVVSYARPGAKIIDAGKRAGQKSADQLWIERQMIEYAGAGLTVARVKGGDPLIFGRGGEELSALAEAGISVEVVSGITSATAVAAALGISLTHREHSHQVVFVCGHTFGRDSQPALPALDRFNGTLVVYMGLNNVATMMDRLIACGLPSTVPAVAVQSATMDNQRFLFAQAGQLACELARAALVSPVAIVIGEVVRLSPFYNADMRSVTEPPSVPLSESRCFTDQSRSEEMRHAGSRSRDAQT